MDPHRLAEERSLALHEAVAARFERDPEILPRARERVRDWLRSGSVHSRYAQAWLDVLELPLADLKRALVDRSEAACALRQVTPFSFVIAPRERWAIWRAVRERGAAAPSATDP